jgi:hypothetical protein
MAILPARNAMISANSIAISLAAVVSASKVGLAAGVIN